jgi:hypothetical protein
MPNWPAYFMPPHAGWVRRPWQVLKPFDNLPWSSKAAAPSAVAGPLFFVVRCVFCVTKGQPNFSTLSLFNVARGEIPHPQIGNVAQVPNPNLKTPALASRPGFSAPIPDAPSYELSGLSYESTFGSGVCSVSICSLSGSTVTKRVRCSWSKSESANSRGSLEQDISTRNFRRIPRFVVSTAGRLLHRVATELSKLSTRPFCSAGGSKAPALIIAAFDGAQGDNVLRNGERPRNTKCGN